MSIEPAFICITLDIRYAYLQTLLAFTLNTNWPPQKIWIKGKVNILNACQKKPFCTKNCFTKYSHPLRAKQLLLSVERLRLQRES